MQRSGIGLLALSLLLGCAQPGEGPAEPPTPGPDDPDPTDPPPPGAIVLQDDVVVAEEDGCVDDVEVSQDREELRFQLACGSPEDAGLVPGAVVVGEAGGGYLRRIETVSVEGDTAVATTAPAALTELFAQASWEVEAALEERDTIDLTGIEVEGEIEGSAEATLSGSLSFTPSVAFSGDIGLDGLESLHLEIDANITGQVGLQASASVIGWLEATVPIGSYSVPVTFSVGGVPVVLVFVLDLYVIIELCACAGAEFTWSATVVSGMRLEVDKADGVWTSSFDPVWEVEAEDPTFEAWASVNARLALRAEPKVLLYGVVGPGGGLEGWIRGEADYHTPPDRIDWALYAGASAELTLDVSVFELWEEQWSLPLWEDEWPIASGSYQP